MALRRQNWSRKPQACWFPASPPGQPRVTPNSLFTGTLSVAGAVVCVEQAGSLREGSEGRSLLTSLYHDPSGLELLAESVQLPRRLVAVNAARRERTSPAAAAAATPAGHTPEWALQRRAAAGPLPATQSRQTPTRRAHSAGAHVDHLPSRSAAPPRRLPASPCIVSRLFMRLPWLPLPSFAQACRVPLHLWVQPSGARRCGSAAAGGAAGAAERGCG